MDDLHENNVSGLDMLWMSIDLQFTAILRSQKIMHVSSKQDMTKELKKESWGKNSSNEYEIQYAWDKQERFVTAQAKAMAGLNKMIESYENLLHKNWDLATEEQKTRVELLKSKLSGNDREPIKIQFVRGSGQSERS